MKSQYLESTRNIAEVFKNLNEEIAKYQEPSEVNKLKSV